MCVFVWIPQQLFAIPPRRSLISTQWDRMVALGRPEARPSGRDKIKIPLNIDVQNDMIDLWRTKCDCESGVIRVVQCSVGNMTL